MTSMYNCHRCNKQCKSKGGLTNHLKTCMQNLKQKAKPKPKQKEPEKCKCYPGDRIINYGMCGRCKGKLPEYKKNNDDGMYFGGMRQWL